LIALYSQVLHYCPDLKSWLWWDGRRWALDRTSKSFAYARDAMIEYAHQAKSAKMDGADDLNSHATSSGSAHAIRDLLTMAQSKLSIPASSLDRHPDLLNFLNGTVDLRTSALRPHNPADLMTRLIHHDYVPRSKPPRRWLDFLDTVLDSNAEILHYLHLAFGYSLTGHTSSKATFIVHGASGNNGKSTLLTAFRCLIPEYSAIIMVDSIISHKQDRTSANADIADLNGARFVQTSESQKGATLSAATLKRLSQGMGEIRARRLYQNPITFPETHKLWIDTNHPPALSDSDDSAVFARLHPVAFPIEIDLEDQDPLLVRKLLEEAEGILAWAAEGARLWYEGGRRLPRPLSMQRELRKWQVASDWAERFLADCCLVMRYAKTISEWSVESSVLYRRYKEWVEDGNDDCFRSHREFTQRLKSHAPIQYRRRRDKSYFWGVKIRKSGRVGLSRDEQDETED
jgi:putative DNA primase/helicase